MEDVNDSVRLKYMHTGEVGELVGKKEEVSRNFKFVGESINPNPNPNPTPTGTESVLPFSGLNGPTIGNFDAQRHSHPQYQ